MKFIITTEPLNNLKAKCLLVFVPQKHSEPILSVFGQDIDAACNQQLSQHITKHAFSANHGQINIIYDPSSLKTDSLCLVGMGDATKLKQSKIRQLMSGILNKLGEHAIQDFSLNVKDMAEVCDGTFKPAQFVQWWVQACHQNQYRYTQTLGEDAKKDIQKNTQGLKTINFIVDNKALLGTIERHIAIGNAIGEGTTLCKNLSNLPGNICTPTYLAKTAQSLGKQYGMATTVLDEAKMKKLGMGALLSVSKGSREPAKLITMEYKGASSKQAPIVLVGKGLTFDAGGISIKPASAMDEMKYDMCGGATVIGIMHALGELKLPINVVGVVASSENLPDGAANKPGDVVTSMLGKTIEILNTDAEGRLILCDALTYVAKFKPEVVIDMATLTGACMVALGQHASGLFSNDEKLANALLKAGESANDRAWQLPIWEEYDAQLKSNFADLANIGGRYAGAVTAACFLQHFAKDYRWAHLDIAGTAWKSGASKGATGRPVNLLMEYLLNSIDA